MQCKYNLFNWKNDVSGLPAHQVCTGAFRKNRYPGTEIFPMTDAFFAPVTPGSELT